MLIQLKYPKPQKVVFKKAFKDITSNNQFSQELDKAQCNRDAVIQHINLAEKEKIGMDQLQTSIEDYIAYTLGLNTIYSLFPDPSSLQYRWKTMMGGGPALIGQNHEFESKSIKMEILCIVLAYAYLQNNKAYEVLQNSSIHNEDVYRQVILLLQKAAGAVTFLQNLFDVPQELCVSVEVSIQYLNTLQSYFQGNLLEMAYGIASAKQTSHNGLSRLAHTVSEKYQSGIVALLDLGGYKQFVNVDFRSYLIYKRLFWQAKAHYHIANVFYDKQEFGAASKASQTAVQAMLGIDQRTVPNGRIGTQMGEFFQVVEQFEQDVTAENMRVYFQDLPETIQMPQLAQDLPQTTFNFEPAFNIQDYIST